MYYKCDGTLECFFEPDVVEDGYVVNDFGRNWCDWVAALSARMRAEKCMERVKLFALHKLCPKAMRSSIANIHM